MPRPEKITSLPQLKDHIDSWAEAHNIRSRFETFQDMYDQGTSRSSIATTFNASYTTVLKWVAKYELYGGESRERK